MTGNKNDRVSFINFGNFVKIYLTGKKFEFLLRLYWFFVFSTFQEESINDICRLDSEKKKKNIEN